VPLVALSLSRRQQVAVGGVAVTRRPIYAAAMGIHPDTGAETPRSRVGRWVRFGLGTPEYELQEVWQLSELIRTRLDEIEDGAAERHREWVASRFRYPLRALLIIANRDGTSYIGFTLVVVAGGFATSGIAVATGAGKGSTASWVVFAIGLLVALAAAISQQLRFGVRSNERRGLAVAMREDGWHFVNQTGDYAGLEPRVAFVRFESQLDDIHRRNSQVDLWDATPPPGPKEPQPEGQARQSP
jgi:Protein of unknown function (DUF4231)